MILLYIILLHYILYFVFKSKNTQTIHCGLFGYIGNGSFDKIRLLGAANDIRGGDSSGVYFSNTKSVTKGIYKNSNFKDLMQGITDEFSNIIIGHDRKASIGTINLESAQPFYENGVVVSHNGTLNNWKELAVKYNIDVNDCVSDSHFITKMLAVRNFEWLSEYYGGATLVWSYDNEDSVYVFKGSSKKWISSVSNTVERPLFGALINNAFYWSSLKEPLKQISETEIETQSIIDIEENKIFKFEMSDELKCHTISTIDRNNVGQFSKPVVQTKHKIKTQSKTKNINISTSDSLFYTHVSSLINLTLKNPVSDGIYEFTINNDQVNTHLIYDNELLFLRGRYFNGKLELMDGSFFINENDLIYGTSNSVKNQTFTKHTFYKGILLAKESYYDIVSKEAKDSRVSLIDVHGSFHFADLLQKYAAQPVLYTSLYDVKTGPQRVLKFNNPYTDSIYHPITTLCSGSLVMEDGMFSGYIPLDLDIDVIVKNTENNNKYKVLNIHPTIVTKEITALNLKTKSTEYLDVNEIEILYDEEYDVKEKTNSSADDITELLMEYVVELYDNTESYMELLKDINNDKAKDLLLVLKEFKTKLMLDD